MAGASTLRDSDGWGPPLQTHSGSVDDALDQEGNRVACFPDGLHRLLVAGVSEVHPPHLSEEHQEVQDSFSRIYHPV